MIHEVLYLDVATFIEYRLSYSIFHNIAIPSFKYTDMTFVVHQVIHFCET